MKDIYSTAITYMTLSTIKQLHICFINKETETMKNVFCSRSVVQDKADI